MTDTETGGDVAGRLDLYREACTVNRLTFPFHTCGSHGWKCELCRAMQNASEDLRAQATELRTLSAANESLRADKASLALANGLLEGKLLIAQGAVTVERTRGDDYKAAYQEALSVAVTDSTGRED